MIIFGEILEDLKKILMNCNLGWMSWMIFKRFIKNIYI
jgi:hypothetical protein